MSRLTHECRASVAVLNGFLAPYIGGGQLSLLFEHVPISADTHSNSVPELAVRDLRTGNTRTISARYFIDATELGDLLPLCQAEYVTGAEAQSPTGELHAGPTAQPANSQSFTFCFAMEYLTGEDHTIDRPEDYQRWRDYVPTLTPPWTGRLLSWTVCDPRSLAPRKAFFDPAPSGPAQQGLNLWTYRRLADPSNFTPGAYKGGITLVNWPQNDYWLGDLITADPSQRAELILQAKNLSFSFL